MDTMLVKDVARTKEESALPWSKYSGSKFSDVGDATDDILDVVLEREFDVVSLSPISFGMELKYKKMSLLGRGTIVTVIKVRPASVADKQGIAAGDQIMEMNSHRAATLTTDQCTSQMQADTLHLYVQRNSKDHRVRKAIKAAEKAEKKRTSKLKAMSHMAGRKYNVGAAQTDVDTDVWQSEAMSRRRMRRDLLNLEGEADLGEADADSAEDTAGASGLQDANGPNTSARSSGLDRVAGRISNTGRSWSMKKRPKGARANRSPAHADRAGSPGGADGVSDSPAAKEAALRNLNRGSETDIDALIARMSSTDGVNGANPATDTEGYETMSPATPHDILPNGSPCGEAIYTQPVIHTLWLNMGHRPDSRCVLISDPAPLVLGPKHILNLD